MRLFFDDYGMRPWAYITAWIAGFVLVFGGTIGGLYAAGAFNGQPSAMVQAKTEGWDNGLLVYYLLLANGQRMQATYSAWNVAQPGASYATYSTAAGDDEVGDDDITDPDTEYEIPQSAISTAASTAQASIPSDDEDFEVSDDDG